MQNSTKKILEELYEISPSLKSEKGLKSLVVFMQHHEPKVKPSKEFKSKLSKKLTTIVDFKQIQPKQKFNVMTYLLELDMSKQKFNVMTYLTPVALMAFGIFVMIQFYNFVSIDQVDMRTLPSPNSQEFIIDDVSSEIEEADQGRVDGSVIDEEVINERELPLSESVDQIIENTGGESQSADTENTVDTFGESVRENIPKAVRKSTEIEETSQDEIVAPIIIPAQKEIEEVKEVEKKSEELSSESPTNKQEIGAGSIINSISESSEETEKQELINEIESLNVLDPIDSEEDTENITETRNVQEIDINSLAEELSNTLSDSVENISNTQIIPQGLGGTAVQELDKQLNSEDDRGEGVSTNEIEVEASLNKEAQETDENINRSSLEQKQGEYYTCRGGELDFIDEIDMKRIIKTYCNEVGGEYEVDAGVCKLNAKQRIGLEYIQRDLCE